MKRVHIVGGKNHGKTTLVVDLVAELRVRGVRVGTIKHTHHHHELDTPGKDSHRHREAGAAVVGILTRSMNAVFWQADLDENSGDLDADMRYPPFDAAFAACDVILVEGDTRTNAPKLEVWRAALDMPPLAPRLANVQAVVTDDPIESSLAVLARSDVRAIGDLIVGL